MPSSLGCRGFSLLIQPSLSRLVGESLFRVLAWARDKLGLLGVRSICLTCSSDTMWDA